MVEGVQGVEEDASSKRCSVLQKVLAERERESSVICEVTAESIFENLCQRCCAFLFLLLHILKHCKSMGVDNIESVCCVLALDSVTSTPQCIRQPKPRDD
jgi:hypothetical protein